MDENLQRRKLEAALSAARVTVTLLEAELAHVPTAGGQNSDLLNVDQALEQYGFGRDALLNANRAGKLELIRGSRNRIMVERSALEAYIKARPVQPRKAAAAPAADLDAWEAQAAAALRSVGGGRG